MINRTNSVLAVLFVAVVVAIGAARVDYSRPNIEILPDMKYSPAWQAYAPNPHFPNGRTLQEPIPGTIARGAMPLDYAATAEDAVRAGEELVNPYAPAGTVPEAGDPAGAGGEDPVRLAGSVDRGGVLYRRFCITCHGPAGAGDGPVTRRGFPPPPSLLAGKSREMRDGQLFHILSYGQGSMAPFAAQLSPDRRWDVVNYVRDLQNRSPEPEPPAAPPGEISEETHEDR